MEDIRSRKLSEDLSFDTYFVLVCRDDCEGRNENAGYASHNQMLIAAAKVKKYPSCLQRGFKKLQRKESINYQAALSVPVLRKTRALALQETT